MNLSWIFDVKEKYQKYRDVKKRNTHWLQQISICVTNRCNARCRMCHAWKNDGKNEATVEEFDLITRDPVFQDMVTISLSGGEPFLRNDLIDICKVIRKNVGDKWFILPTNSVTKEKILKTAITLKEFMRFNICMSLDGVGELHDKIRGVKGLFNNNWLWLEEKLGDYGIYHDISCTIIKSNVHQIETIKDFARSRNLFFCFRPAANVSSDYFDMESNPEAITSRADMMYVYKRLKDLHEKEMTCTDIGTLDFLRKGKRPIPCGAGYFSVIVMANLDVYPCSHCTWKMGNLRDFDYRLTTLLDSKQAKRVRKEFVNKCRACVNDIEFPATLFAGASYGYLFFKRGLRHIVNRISCHLKGGH